MLGIDQIARDASLLQQLMWSQCRGAQLCLCFLHTAPQTGRAALTASGFPLGRCLLALFVCLDVVTGPTQCFEIG